MSSHFKNLVSVYDSPSDAIDEGIKQGREAAAKPPYDTKTRGQRMAKKEKLTLSAVAANIVDIFCDTFGRSDSGDFTLLEQKIIKELKPLKNPKDYGYETNEIVD
ncbi:hypothetical protein LCGC14_1463940 [marine sediment metagenome]|uniref:Uncharacterized protein n=1 Tax=marine sediment metagenome TaxID=412755 RepID=A0A0F9JE98_9ZZZZ